MILWSLITTEPRLVDQLAARTFPCFLSVRLHAACLSLASILLVCGVQAELEELVKKEHARIDSQDKSSQKAAGEQSAAAAAAAVAATTEPKKEE